MVITRNSSYRDIENDLKNMIIKYNLKKDVTSIQSDRKEIMKQRKKEFLVIVNEMVLFVETLDCYIDKCVDDAQMFRLIYDKIRYCHLIDKKLNYCEENGINYNDLRIRERLNNLKK